MHFLVASALLADLMTFAPRTCWRDGAAAGQTLAQEYCSVMANAYNTGGLDVSGVTGLSVCRGQGLTCKSAMADALTQDRNCARLYHTDYVNDGLQQAGYSARSLYDVFAQVCGENAD